MHARTRNEVFARRFDGAWVVSQRPRDEVAEKVRAFQKGVAAVALLPDEEAVVRFERAAGGDEALSDRERALTAAARQAHRAGRAREARLLRAWVATLAVAAVAAVAAGVWLRGKNRELLEGRVRAELDAAHRRANDHEVREAVRAAVEATRAWLEAGRRLDEFDARVAEDLVAVAVADRLAGEVVLRAPDGPPTGATLSRDGRTLRYATGRRVFQAEAPRYEPRVAATYGERVVQMVSDPSGGTSWVMLADGTRHALGGPRDRQAIAVPATLPNPSWHSRRFLLPRGGLLHCEGAAYVYAPVEGAPRPLAACGPELTQSTVEGSADENYVAASWAGGVDGERPSRALWSLRDGRCFHSASLPEAERVAVTPDGAFAIFTHAPAQGAVRSAVVDLRSGAEFPLKASQPTCALPEPFNIQMDSLIVEPTTGRMLAQDRGGLVWTELRPDGRSSPAPGPPTLGGGGFAASEDGHLVGTLRRGVLHPWSLGEGDARTPLSYLTPGGLRTHLLLDASWSRSVLTGDDGILYLRRSDMLRDARIISFAPSDSSPCEPHFVDQNTLWVDGRSALRLGMRRSGTTFQEVNAPERCEATSGHSSPSSVLTASELGEVTIKRRDGSAGILMSSNAVGGDVLLLGRDFYAAVAEGVPTLIDAASSRPLFASPAPTPRHYALSPDERSLATARPDGTRTRLSLWRRAGPAFQHLHGWWVDEDVQALAFREGDRAVVTVSVDRWLSVYEARNGTRARRVRLPLDGEVYAMTTHGSLVALETRDSVLLFGIARDIVRVQLPGSLGERPGRASLHFSPDGRMLLAGTLQRSGAYVLLLPTRLDDALASLCQGLRWREAPRGEAADLIAWCARHDPTARGGDLVW